MTTAQDQQSRATGWVAPKDRYTAPVLFNPYTGQPRDARDIQSDPQGALIAPPGAAWQAARALPARGVDTMLDTPADMEPAAWIDMQAWPPIRWPAGKVRADFRDIDGMALYTAAQVQAMGRVPPGHVAVPVEPTSKQVVLMAGAILQQQHGTGDTRHPCWPQAVEQAEKAYRAAIDFAPRPPAAQSNTGESRISPTPAAQEVPSGVLDAIRAAGMQLLKGVDGFKLEKAVTASPLNAGSATQEGA